MIKIGINGFGRIGRVILRILSQRPEEFEVCGVNLRKADIDYMVYLLKYDSVFRNFPGTVEHAGGDLVVNGHHIKVYSESDAAMIDWSQCGAEYIIESTGANNTTDKASRHFKGAARRRLSSPRPPRTTRLRPLSSALTATSTARTCALSPMPAARRTVWPRSPMSSTRSSASSSPSCLPSMPPPPSRRQSTAAAAATGVRAVPS